MSSFTNEIAKKLEVDFCFVDPYSSW